MKVRRIWALLAAVVLTLSGCAPQIVQDDTQQIYSSFYPIYALSSLVLEDVPGIRLKCLVQPQDDCLRLYDLSEWDASVLAYDADCVIIGGSGLESFENSLYTFGDNGPAIIDSTYQLKLFNQDGNSGIDGVTGHLADANPHMYMSASGARRMLGVIGEALAALYPENAAEIAANVEKADAVLEKTENQIQDICAAFAGEKVILMNEALIYPAIEYGLEVVYRYDRESGTTLYGSSLEEALKEFASCGADVIMIEKHAPAELTEALEDAGYTVALMDVMSSYSNDAGGAEYVEALLENAQTAAGAFSKTEG